VEEEVRQRVVQQVGLAGEVLGLFAAAGGDGALFGAADRPVAGFDEGQVLTMRAFSSAKVFSLSSYGGTSWPARRAPRPWRSRRRSGSGA
jgi:hypothetical protein